MMLLSGDAAKHGGSFLDSLPDPMKPTLFEVGFVVVVLVLLYFYLKRELFLPLGKLMDDREVEMQAGASVKLEVAKRVEVRRAEYEENLKALRARAFERRRELSQAANEEKTRLADAARRGAASAKSEAVEKLAAQRETAKKDLMSQVDSLADNMVQHLLKQG